jgi:hypothetical protein
LFIGILKEYYFVLFKEAERLTNLNFDIYTFSEKFKSGNISSSLYTVGETKEDDQPFFFINLSKRHISSRSELGVYGAGFTNPELRFRFRIGGVYSIPSCVIDDKFIKIFVPASLDPGIYDIFAEYKTKDERWVETKEAYPIHII